MLFYYRVITNKIVFLITNKIIYSLINVLKFFEEIVNMML